ncbi:protein phosphatase 2C, partial [Caulochytrium protostelioides]
MGQTLSEPIVLKDSSAGVDQRLMYGASAMQGWRVTMEDAHTTIMNLEEELPFGTNTGAGRRVEPGHAFFAVYDGHGGSRVAQYSGKNLHRVLVKPPLFVAHEYEKAIRAVFLQMDQNLREDPEYKEEASGCTAVMVLLTPDNELYCGNAGDSRGVLSRAGTAVPLSYDHKPTNPKETERIHNAGGFVEYGRVNGNLALSRAMGDFEFKNNARLPPEEQTVTAAPDVTRTQLTFPDDEFIILACDGIWDCMTSQAAVEWVSLMIANGAELHAICETMMNGCVA